MLEEVWKEAVNHLKSTKLNTTKSESRIFKGVKIEKTEGFIKIYNTKLCGDMYKEVSNDQYKFFIDNGYVKGVHNVCLFNYERSLELLKERIRTEVGGRNNQKHYKSLKESRNILMERYTKIINYEKSNSNEMH